MKPPRLVLLNTELLKVIFVCDPTEDELDELSRVVMRMTHWETPWYRPGAMANKVCTISYCPGIGDRLFWRHIAITQAELHMYSWVSSNLPAQLPMLYRQFESAAFGAEPLIRTWFSAANKHLVEKRSVA